jgi:hypothetical protein
MDMTSGLVAGCRSTVGWTSFLSRYLSHVIVIVPADCREERSHNLVICVHRVLASVRILLPELQPPLTDGTERGVSMRG